MEVHGDALTPHIIDCINSIISKEKFLNHTVSVKLKPTDGGSFLGTLREVTIKGETKDGHNKEVDLFIKTIIPDVNYALYSIHKAYTKEAFAYTDLLRVFDEMQNEYNVPAEERYNLVKGYDESDANSIIMENLTKRGYTTLNRMVEQVPLKFVELSIQQLAKFHGLSIILQEKKTSYFEENIMTLKQPIYYGSAWNAFIKNANNLGLSCLSAELKAKVLKYLPEDYNKYESYKTDPAAVRCLVHGDFRLNNIMAHVKEDKSITEVAVIDYQMMFYGCPIIDFLYFIFGNTNQQLRKTHLEHIKDLYHNTMGDFLKYFEMDVEKFYPKKEFESQFKKKLDYGLALALWLIPVTLAKPGEVPNVTKVNLADSTVEMNDVVKSRVRGVVDDFLEWGYL